MGFFSYKCLGCGHPMLGPMATNKTNGWMSEVVVLFEDGSVWKGEYDGYGRVDGQTLPYPLTTSCWHRSCWMKAGQPEFTEVSENADDQGWFFDEGEHDLPDPGVVHASS